MENPMNMDDTWGTTITKRKPKKLVPQHKKLRAPDATLILALVPPGKIIGLVIASSDILKTLLDGPEGAMMLPDRLHCLLSNGVSGADTFDQLLRYPIGC